MTTWDGFYNHILADVNGVTPALVDHVLRQVAIEFCEKTCLHTEDASLISVVGGTSEYDLFAVTADTEPYKVKAAWFDGAPLDIAPIDALNAVYPYWGDDTSQDPYAYTQKQPDKIILYPQPTENLTSGLRVELILRPTQSAPGLVDWIAERYTYELACGAKGRLMAQPQRPWSSPEHASYFLSVYNNAVARGRIEANNSLTRAALSVRPRPFVR